MLAIVRRAPAVAALALFSFSLAAQPSPVTNEVIDVSIVNVDVFVTDRDGNRVRGLTAADFEIFENGKRQPVSNFAEYAPEAEARAIAAEPRTSTSGTTTTATTTAAPEKRTIVVFLESITLAPFQTKAIFDSLREMLRRTVRPGDAVAVVSWLNAALVRQDFTDDLESIESALTKIEEESTGAEWNIAEEIRRRQEFAQAFQRDLVAAGYPVQEADATTFHALSGAQAELNEIRQKSFALRAYIEAIAGFEGKKILIMGTRRFGQYAGSEYFGGEVPFRARGELDTRPFREAVIAAANANNVTIYPIYPRGLGSTLLAGAEESGRSLKYLDRDADLRRFSRDNYTLLNETSSLQEIARETGGMLAWGSKDISQLMPRIAEDLDSYYSLGYRATATGKDAARNIRVTVRNRDYVVRARRRYVEKSDETRMSDLVIANLVHAAPGGPLLIEVEAGDVTEEGGLRLVPLRIAIPASALAAGEGSFEVLLASGGAFGIVSEVERRTQHYTSQRPKDGWFTYDVTVKIPRAAYRLSVGVLDPQSRAYGLAHLELPIEEDRD